METTRNKKYNTTKLVNALATLLPPLFLEARVFGGGKQLELVTQFGLSIPATQNMDIAIFTRTSGAAFAVGIGSFVAYKMLCRLIKSNSIWTALEQLSPNEEQKDQKASISTNNEAVILAEGFYAVRLGGENELLRRLDEFLSASTASEADKTEAKPHVAVVQVRQANALKRLFRRNQHLQQTGIASMDSQIINREENEEQIKNTIASRGDIVRYGSDLIVERRKELTDEIEDEDNGGNLSDCSQLSCNTSASRAFCINNHNNSNSSSTCSEKSSETYKSALLNLHCENELFWEDEFSNERGNKRELETEELIDDEGLFLFREREGSLGGLSQLSAMKNLEKMFSNDWLNKNTNEEDIEDGDSLLDNALDNLRELSSLDDVAASCSSLLNTTQTKQQDYISHKSKDEPRLPFTAYKIVLQNELSETSSSLCGGSTRSDRFGRYCCPSSPHRQQRKRLEAAPVSTSQGLWELTKSDGINSRSTSEKQCLELYKRKERSNNNQLGPMVDSIISINSHASSSIATSSSAQIQMPHSGAMIDSAIGTDFQSSADDDDWKEQYIEEGDNTENVTIRPRTKSGVFRRYGGDVDSSKGIILRPLSKISEQQSATATPVKKTKTAITKSNISTSSLDGSESSLEWF
ncbi:hypothetical protein ACQ4LE_011053 [Meloidogyne hapla]|uniref:Uncharacterized protein n=1 Tax=Meloidogyne hapla TaxID=6305 RepID=A0A1I8BVX5_MELHA